MRMNKIALTFLVFMFGWLICFTTAVQAGGNQSDPVGLLQYISNNMISQLKANKATLKTKPQIVYNLAYRYVVPYADLDEMSKRVLPPEVWNSATPAQRQQFKHQFTTLLIRTYASALAAYKDQTVQFYPPRGSLGNTVEVSSEIDSSANQPIHVTYRLIRSGSGWRLFDMSVEGVSLIDSFQSQFADILSQGNMETLLNRLGHHNTRKVN